MTRAYADVCTNSRIAHREPPLRRNRNFVLLAVGQGVSRLGDGIYAAALVWTAWELTLTPSQVGLVALAAGLPSSWQGWSAPPMPTVTIGAA